eukprot:334115-Chlamydomonas_euryale.AAC.4
MPGQRAYQVSGSARGGAARAARASFPNAAMDVSPAQPDAYHPGGENLTHAAAAAAPRRSASPLSRTTTDT